MKRGRPEKTGQETVKVTLKNLILEDTCDRVECRFHCSQLINQDDLA